MTPRNPVALLRAMWRDEPPTRGQLITLVVVTVVGSIPGAYLVHFGNSAWGVALEALTGVAIFITLAYLLLCVPWIRHFIWNGARR